jgi:hypothetical protein
MTYQLIQGVYEFLPKANVRPHDELKGREIRRGEVRKGALAGHDVHPVALGMQMEIGKYRRVSVEPRHLGLKRFSTGNTHQPPAAAKVQHAGLRGHAALIEIVQQHKAGRPDLVPMERGLLRGVL